MTSRSGHGAGAGVACSHCGWRGTWKDVVWSEEGDWENGYWKAPHCPNFCDDETADYTLVDDEEAPGELGKIEDF